MRALFSADIAIASLVAITRPGVIARPDRTLRSSENGTLVRLLRRVGGRLSI
jgi:hypothetical protein